MYYFTGEAVAYYFAWMNFYTTCVLIPAIVGILIYLFRADGINVLFDPYLPIFAYFMAIWGVTYTIVSLHISHVSGLLPMAVRCVGYHFCLSN